MTTSSRGEPLLAAPSAMGAPSVRFLVLVIVLSLSFFLNFVAFNAAQSLDGSLPAPPGVASTQFMVIYITFGVLCIPAPKLISFIGPKAAIILGMATYVGVTASFLAPPMCTSGTAASAPCWSAQSIWTLRMLTAALLGLGAPILWTGQGVYLGRLAAHEASRLLRADQAPPEKAAQVRGRVLKRFNGIFWTAFQASGAVGLVGASLVLVLVRSSHATFYLFLGLSACSIGGLACVVTLLPRLPPADEPAALGVAEEATAEAGDDGTGAADGPPPVTILATLRLCADARMLLLVPNIVYNGMSLAFMWYLYNTFVFSTALGTSFVGFGAAFGFFISAIATTASSRVAARFGQLPTMTVADAATATPCPRRRACTRKLQWPWRRPTNALRVAPSPPAPPSSPPSALASPFALTIALRGPRPHVCTAAAALVSRFTGGHARTTGLLPPATVVPRPTGALLALGMRPGHGWRVLACRQRVHHIHRKLPHRLRRAWRAVCRVRCVPCQPRADLRGRRRLGAM